MSKTRNLLHSLTALLLVMVMVLTPFFAELPTVAADSEKVDCQAILNTKDSLHLAAVGSDDSAVQVLEIEENEIIALTISPQTAAQPLGWEVTDVEVSDESILEVLDKLPGDANVGQELKSELARKDALFVILRGKQTGSVTINVQLTNPTWEKADAEHYQPVELNCESATVPQGTKAARAASAAQRNLSNGSGSKDSSDIIDNGGAGEADQNQSGANPPASSNGTSGGNSSNSGNVDDDKNQDAGNNGNNGNNGQTPGKPDTGEPPVLPTLPENPDDNNQEQKPDDQNPETPGGDQDGDDKNDPNTPGGTDPSNPDNSDQPQQPAACDFCGSTEHTTAEHPLCGICSSPDHAADAHCGKCNALGHVAEDHCGKCDAVDHQAEDHCEYCDAVGHSIDDHTCTICDGIFHTAEDHCTECGSLEHAADAHCGECGSLEHTTDAHCSECGSLDHAVDAHCPICHDLGHTADAHCAICTSMDHTADAHCGECGSLEHTTDAHCSECGSLDHTASAHCPICKDIAHQLHPLDLTGVSLAENNFVYNGEAPSLELTGAPEGVDLKFNVISNPETNAGDYQYVVKVEVPEGYAPVGDLTFDYTIEKAKASVEQVYNEETGVVDIKTTGIIPADIDGDPVISVNGQMLAEGEKFDPKAQAPSTAVVTEQVKLKEDAANNYIFEEADLADTTVYNTKSDHQMFELGMTPQVSSDGSYVIITFAMQNLKTEQVGKDGNDWKFDLQFSFDYNKDQLQYVSCQQGKYTTGAPSNGFNIVNNTNHYSESSNNIISDGWTICSLTFNILNNSEDIIFTVNDIRFTPIDNDKTDPLPYHYTTADSSIVINPNKIDVVDVEVEHNPFDDATLIQGYEGQEEQYDAALKQQLGEIWEDLKDEEPEQPEPEEPEQPTLPDVGEGEVDPWGDEDLPGFGESDEELSLTVVEEPILAENTSDIIVAEELPTVIEAVEETIVTPAEDVNKDIVIDVVDPEISSESDSEPVVSTIDVDTTPTIIDNNVDSSMASSPEPTPTPAVEPSADLT